MAGVALAGLIAASPSQAADGTFAIERAFPGLFFNQPVLLTNAGGAMLYVVEQRGVIQSIDPATQERDEYLDISGRVNEGGSEEGLLGLAFAPDFADSGHLFVYYSAASPRRSVLARFTAPAGGRPDPGSELVLLEVPQRFTNHNGGMIAFGPDGMLYVALGDGGSDNDNEQNGQDLSTLLGSILRLDVSEATSAEPYRVPPDNPFVTTAGARPEIWAYGFRNPWRFSFDSAATDPSGALWVGDVGEGLFEEVDRVVRGGNYGWNTMEGLHCFERSSCDQDDLELPVAEYSHDFGCAVTGGYVYHGARVPSLDGAYIYSDFCSGRIWAVRDDGSEPRQIADQDMFVPSFWVDAEDELYIVTLNGQLFRFATDLSAPAPTATPTSAPPAPPTPTSAPEPTPTAQPITTPTPTATPVADDDCIAAWIVGMAIALAVGALGVLLRFSPLF
jgi:glucose/arabinose dehydrogenase